MIRLHVNNNVLSIIIEVVNIVYPSVMSVYL